MLNIDATREHADWLSVGGRVRALGGPGSGNFGHAGRPGEIGGSAPRATAPPASVLEQIHTPDGGFTYHAVTGAQPTTGYALSVHPERGALMNDQEADVVALAEYAAKNWDLLSQENNFLGGWHNPDDGKVYLDVSTVVQTEAEAERLGREADQLAYFDLVKGQSIKITPHVKAASHAQLDWISPRSTDTQRPHRPREALDGTRTHGRGDRESETDPGFAALGGPGSGNFGHAGRPGEVGGSTPRAEKRTTISAAAMRTMPLPADISAAEDRIRRETHEHAFIARDGQVVDYYGNDAIDHVRLDPSADYANVVFTHNHPGQYAFSIDDIHTAAFHNMQEIRAVTMDGAYSMKRVGDTWPSPDVLHQLAVEENSNVREYFERRIKAGQLTIAKAEQQHWTAVWLRVETRVKQEFPTAQIAFTFEPRQKKVA